MESPEEQKRRRPKPSASRLVQLIREIPDNAFQAVKDVSDKLTLSRIFLFLVASFFVTGSVLLYENRLSLVEYAFSLFRDKTNVVEWELSQSSKIEMVKLVRKSDLANMIMVTKTNLQRNRREPMFWHLEGDKAEMVRGLAVVSAPQPIFDNDGKNTTQMLAILNNEFLCTPYQDTVFYKMIPQMAEEVPFICRISIPPVYGNFTGILTFGLKRAPTIEELTILKQDAAAISNYIYLVDIIKKPSLLPHV